MKAKKALQLLGTFGNGEIHLFPGEPSFGVAIGHFGSLVVQFDPGMQVPFGTIHHRDLRVVLPATRGDLVLSTPAQSVLFIQSITGVQQLTCIRAGTHPGKLPPIPFDRLKLVPDWSLIARVFHAAAPNGEVRPGLENICFGRTGVGASDEVSVAFAEVGIGNGQQFEAKAFMKWPTGPVECFMDSKYGWFRAGDEIRILPVRRGWFPRLRDVVMGESAQHLLEIDPAGWVKALETLMQATKRKTVRLHGSGTPPFALIPHPNEMGAVPVFLQTKGRGGPVNVLLDGRRVVEALWAVKSASPIWLGYWEDSRRPVRIQTAGYREDIYPLLEVDSPHAPTQPKVDGQTINVQTGTPEASA